MSGSQKREGPGVKMQKLMLHATIQPHDLPRWVSPRIPGADLPCSEHPLPCSPPVQRIHLPPTRSSWLCCPQSCLPQACPLPMHLHTGPPTCLWGPSRTSHAAHWLSTSWAVLHVHLHHHHHQPSPCEIPDHLCHEGQRTYGWNSGEGEHISGLGRGSSQGELPGGGGI